MFLLEHDLRANAEHVCAEIMRKDRQCERLMASREQDALKLNRDPSWEEAFHEQAVKDRSRTCCDGPRRAEGAPRLPGGDDDCHPAMGRFLGIPRQGGPRDGVEARLSRMRGDAGPDRRPPAQAI